MTTTVPNAISRPDFIADPKGKPEFAIATSAGCDQAVIIAREFCPVCDGEGRFEYEVPGGYYNPHAQGGMWLPDTREVKCGTCDGTGLLRVRRCAACGLIEADDENGLTMHDKPIPFCDCDEDTLTDFLARLTIIEELASEQLVMLKHAEDVGCHFCVGVHRLTWNEVHALAAKHDTPVRYFPPDSGNRPFVAADVQAGKVLIPVFGAWKS